MTSRLTCLLIFTLLLGSPAYVFANNDPSSTPGPPGSGGAGGPPGSITHVCPGGEAVTSQCKSGADCTGICYRSMKSAGTPNSRCCGPSSLGKFCPTELYAKHSSNSDSTYLYTKDSNLKQDLWIEHEELRASDDMVVCPIPNSFTLKLTGEKYVPVDWDEAKESANEKSATHCQTNKDCAEGGFCDAVWNPSFGDSLDRSGKDNKSLRFCYQLPKLPPNMKHVEHPNGLKLCGKQGDCGKPDEICHLEKRKFNNESNPKQPASGICVHVDSCLQTDSQVRAVLNQKNQLCQDDAGCQDAGVSKNNFDFNPHCRAYFKADESRKLCCFEKNPVCRIGKASTPLKNCTKMSDCTGDVLVKDAQWNTWCDDGTTKTCCRDPDNRKWQCPDLVTPLFNEPKCTGSSDANIHSGKCPKKGGRCVLGHCCPPLTISENGTKVELGRNLYETEFPCNPESSVPSGFSYAFCNSETKKLVVVGKFHNNGDSMTKVSGSKCTINSDCAKDGSAVCVYENDKNHVCYYNPLRALRPQVSSFWKTILIVSLICAGIFLVTSLICFVCYRSKSVFDKYKPKKKGKKGKGSDSKSSKGSKNKKKGGKKGGKKGKKGEESSSTKSKTKSKKDTEKSKSEVGTTGDGSTSSQMN